MPGHPPDRRRTVPDTISVRGERSESRVTAPQAPPLRVSSPGSRLELRKDGPFPRRPAWQERGGGNRRRPVPGTAAGRPPAVRRRRLACLAAHHSEARFEIELRGHREELSEYAREDSNVYDALVYCDLTTGPDGETMAFEDRVSEVYQRYGEGDISRALRMAEPYLRAAVDRIGQAMNASDFPER
jgi:hypothetical protein